MSVVSVIRFIKKLANAEAGLAEARDTLDVMNSLDPIHANIFER
jgi:hypothetical protein